jgi:hypothetical protein
MVKGAHRAATGIILPDRGRTSLRGIMRQRSIYIARWVVRIERACLATPCPIIDNVVARDAREAIRKQTRSGITI